MKTLSTLKVKVDACQKCGLCRTNRTRVSGRGRKTAPVMFVNQSPTWEDVKSNRSFAGIAGAFQSNILKSIGIDEAQIYFTNLIKCYPGKNGYAENVPPADSIFECEIYLEREIEIIKPRVIIAVGPVVMRWFGIAGGIKQNSGKLFKTDKGDVVPILHPAGVFYRVQDAPEYATQLHYIDTLLNEVSLPPARENEHQWMERRIRF